MAKQRQGRIDSVGWVFWFIAFLVLLAPAIYFCIQIVDEDKELPIPVAMGVLLALFLAAIVSWIVNTILQTIAKRKYTNTRKKAKKR